MQEELLRLTDAGLYCEAGDFYIDPWQPVDRAVVTHAHADHFSPGSRAYLVSENSLSLFRSRLGSEAHIDSVGFGVPVSMNGVRLSFHPAGHILGSAQVRVELGGQIWVVSGDYKIASDPTCTPFSLVPCHTFVTEATFGLPIFRWPDQNRVFDRINDWWRANQQTGRASLLFAYALGKAQRVMAGVDPAIGPVFTHGAVERVNQIYRSVGVRLPSSRRATQASREELSGALIIAPPSAKGTRWLRRFGSPSTAFTSGWMRVRGMRRRRAVDRGFVLSDHADWPALLETILATGAEHVWVTHGYVPVVVRWLREQGLDARGLPMRYPSDGGKGEEEGTE